ncbi:MAG: tRNA (guanosine(37)-N1)-methyltransferase TrmD [Alphaproteobacteria bacterium]|nr:tRNA (guanosine(37)-N1)-methyltransferase TrmD [Alphaproteobacteria bacterium]MBL0718061.1 tRNA (guanosine(37)-N1)-methyltransferase TrmD [Alphaproteobacteria bacterium]
MKNINIITLYPEIFPASLGVSVINRGLTSNLWKYNLYNPRDYTEDKHRTVDDTPYSGGAGMLMRADILGRTIDNIPEVDRGRMIFVSPRGRTFNQAMAEEWSREDNFTFLCGRFEGVDQRVIDYYNFEEVSLGNFVLAGGEVAVLAMVESTIRLQEGILGNKLSLEEESFSKDKLLEHDQYTTPAEWRGHKVPPILLSGNHSKIKEWKKDQSLKITQNKL